MNQNMMPMQPSPQGMPPQGMPPQGAPNPNVKAFLNAASAQGPLSAPPPGAPAPQGALMPAGPSGQPPMAGQGAQQTPQIDPQMLQMLQQIAAMGRGGDSLLAHLTPGEVAVPPEVQSPKVLATLNKEFNKKGVQMDQFTAGSPNSSLNPSTSLPEYNFMSAFLPAALGIAGSLALPGLGTGLSAGLAGALGGGLGTTAGGLLAGQKPLQAILSGVGAGAGGYAANSLFNPSTAAAAASTGQGASQAGTQAANAAANGGVSAGDPFGAIGQSVPNGPLPSLAPQSTLSSLTSRIPSAIGSGIGAFVGGQMGKPVPNTPVAKPSGFDDRFPTPSNYPSWQSALGQNNYSGPQPNFTGYDASNPMSHTWNFFPSATQNM